MEILINYPVIKSVIFFLVAFLLGFYGYISFSIINNVLTLPNEFYSAFWGAFASFLFVRLAEMLDSIRKRLNRHYDSLVLLALQLNKMLGIIKDNIYIMEGFRKHIEQGNIHFSSPKNIPIDESHFNNLYSIDLMQDIFSFQYNVRKLNDDIDSLVEGYNDIKNAYIQHNIGVEQYIENAKLMGENIEMLIAFQDKSFEDIKALLAKAKIHMHRDQTLFSRFTSQIFGFEYKISPQSMQKELDKINKELEESSEASRKEIDELLKQKGVKI